MNHTKCLITLLRHQVSPIDTRRKQICFGEPSLRCDTFFVSKSLPSSYFSKMDFSVNPKELIYHEKVCSLNLTVRVTKVCIFFSNKDHYVQFTV